MFHSITVDKVLDKDNIIDIRSIEKYNDNHIPNAKNIPMPLLIKFPNKYLDKNKTYYIYCQKGINSVRVCAQLSKMGYDMVNIIGGYEAWILKKA